MGTPEVPIPLPLSSSPGGSPQESGGRLINCFAEALGETAGTKAAWHRSPGLTLFALTGLTGFRGAILANGLIFAAVHTSIISIDASAFVTVIGTMAGTDPVIFARNNKAPTSDIVAVCAAGSFLVSTGGISAYSGGGILPAINSVTFQDGYFFFSTGNRLVYASALNDTPVNALTFVTLEGRPAVAGVRVIAYKGLLIAFTTSSAEIWQDTAQATPAFPYSRLAVVDRGLLASAAVAGDTESFGTLLWVGDDYGVYKFSGLFQPEKVSSPDLDRLIQAQAAIDPTQLFAGCYVVGGRSMWTLSSPNWTWEFNNNTSKWSERSSFYSGLLSRWRAIGGLMAYGHWMVGDDQTGNLVFVDPSKYSELGSPQLFRLESGPVENFPNRIRVGRIDIDMATGVGQTAGTTPNETDPVIMISWSDDDGAHWVGPITRPLGEAAEAFRRIWAASLGRTGAQGRRWRFDVSDDVYVGVLKATMRASARDA